MLLKSNWVVPPIVAEAEVKDIARAISLVYTQNPQEEVEKILSQLKQESGSVYILGRYNKQAPACFRYPNLQTSFYTVHKAKGSEADCVIVWSRVWDHGLPLRNR